MKKDVYNRLKELNIVLSKPAGDNDYFKVVKQFSGNCIYVSGIGPVIDEETACFGTLPELVSMEQGRQMARNCVINILSELDFYLGDLNRIKSLVKILVFVASDKGFTEQHLVAHGASELFISVLGEEVGKSARSAVGVSGLPFNFPVEVEALIEI